MSPIQKLAIFVLVVLVQACSGGGNSGGTADPEVIPGTDIEQADNPDTTAPQNDTDNPGENTDSQSPDPTVDPGENTDPVTDLNLPPEFIGDIPDIELQTSLSGTYNLSLNFSDPDDDELIFQLGEALLPPGFTLNESTGILEGQSESKGDTAGLILTATDSAGNSISSNPFSIRIFNVSTDCSLFGNNENDLQTPVSQISETNSICLGSAYDALTSSINSGSATPDIIARQMVEQIRDLPQSRKEIPAALLSRMLGESFDALNGESIARIYNQLT